MTEERKIDQRIFDLHDEYCDGRIDRREFLGRSAAITIGGVSALWMAEALMLRRADAAAGPEVAAREGRRAMAINEKTANALLLDTIRIEGEAEPGLEAYLEGQARACSLAAALSAAMSTTCGSRTCPPARSETGSTSPPTSWPTTIRSRPVQ